MSTEPMIVLEGCAVATMDAAGSEHAHGHVVLGGAFLALAIILACLALLVNRARLWTLLAGGAEAETNIVSALVGGGQPDGGAGAAGG